MRIAFLPQLRTPPTAFQQQTNLPMALARAGDALTIDGEVFDFGPLEDGYVLPPSAIGSSLFLVPVRRVDGQLRVTIVLPHGPDAPDATRFPADVVDPPDGAIALPPYGHGEPVNGP